MGQTITQSTDNSKENSEVEIDTFLLLYFQQFQKHKTLSNGLMLKTVMLGNEEEGEPIVLKMLFKSIWNDKGGNLYAKQVQSLQELGSLVTPSRCPNIAQILQILDLPVSLITAGVVIRQYFEFNLRDRLGREPYLTQIEKKWICFQLLYAVTQLHNCGICHGDIKLENVLLTTYHSVFLSDIALYKPTRIRVDDMSTYTYFFSNSKESKSCYLAPERLVLDSTEMSVANSDLKPEMDVFSLGVVIAEVFLEDVVIDYSKLVNLQKGNLNLSRQLRNIHNDPLESLLVKMMDPHPKTRISLSNAFDTFANSICPISIPRMLMHINSMIISYNYSDSDLLVGLIYRHWIQIWRCLFNNDTPPAINYPLSPYTLNQLTKAVPISKLFIENFPLIFSQQNNTSLDMTQVPPSSSLSLNNNHQCSIIIINYLLQVLLNLKYDANMTVAIDLLKHLTMKSSDLVKINHVVPYLIKALDKSYGLSVQMKAFSAIITLLMSIKEEELILKSIDYKVFNYYIFEELTKVYYEGGDCLKVLLVSHLYALIELENKFLFSELNSKYQFLNPLNSTKVEMNTSVFLPKAVTHKENVLLAKPSEILKDYETDLNHFKGKIMDIITDIITQQHSYEIEVVLIRQIPQLVLFFGTKEILKFSKVVLDVFYQGNWLLQREVVKLFPKLALISGDATLMSYFHLFIESILSKNASELLTFDMLHSLMQLVKMEYITSRKVIETVQRILVYLLHPNLFIRNEVTNVLSQVFQTISQTNIYIFLWKEMKACFDIPVIVISNDLIKTYLQKRIARGLYQFIDEGNADSALVISTNEREIVSKLIRKVYNSSKAAFDIISNEVHSKAMEVIRSRESDFALTQRKVMTKEISAEIKTNNYTQEEDVKCVLEKILGKLLYINDNDYSIPKYSAIEQVDFSNKNSNFYSSDCFAIKYLMKVLDISFEFKELQKKLAVNMKKDLLIPSTSFYLTAKSLLNWKPKGELVSTIYPNQSNQRPLSMYKLLLCSNNSFLSFDSHNMISLWSIESSEWDIHANRLSSMESKEKVTNNKELICGNDRDEFLIGLNKGISSYRIDSSKGDFTEKSGFISENDVTCLRYLPSPQMNQFIATDKRGGINVYDLRMKQNALKHTYSTEKGIVRTMDAISSNNPILMGTSSGYLLNYDLRLNYVTDVYYYSNTDPSAQGSAKYNSITSINHFTPDPKTDYGFLALKSRQSTPFDYVFITTNSPEHEIGLWNLSTLKCGLMLQTTKRKRDSPSQKTIEVNLPRIQKEKSFFYHRRDIQEDLQRYIANQILQRSLKTSLLTFEDDYLRYTPPQANIANAYGNNTSTINCALCPYITDSSCNSSYILTAGNDRMVRFWDFSSESTDTFNTIKCSIVAKTNEIESNLFIRSFSSLTEKLIIIQSNDIVSDYPTDFTEATHELSITDMILHKDGPHLLSCGLDGLIKIWK